MITIIETITVHSRRRRSRKRHYMIALRQRIITGTMAFACLFTGTIIGSGSLASATNNIDNDKSGGHQAKSIYAKASVDISVSKIPPITSNDLFVIEYDNTPKEELVVEETSAPIIEYTETAVSVSVTPIYSYDSIPMPQLHQDYVYAMAEKYNLQPGWLFSQIWRESGFRKDIVSRTSDYGYGQINKGNFEWMHNAIGFNPQNPCDPYKNLEAQAYIMRNIIDTYHPDNYHTLLMTYNMGYGNVKECWVVGQYSNQYSRDIVQYAADNFGLTDINLYY